MPVKLNSAGGGSVTLTTPSTASDFTATFPANTGNVVTTGSTAAVTPAMLSTGAPNWDSSGNLSFNSGFGSAAVAYGCRAWVNFNGTGVVAIRASGNVTSITDNGTGDYTVNFSTAMPDTNYSPVVTASDTNSIGRYVGSLATSSSQTRIRTQDAAGAGGDQPNIYVAFIR